MKMQDAMEALAAGETVDVSKVSTPTSRSSTPDAGRRSSETSSPERAVSLG